MSKIAFYELSQCILSYHDWIKVDGLWDLLPNYQKNLTDKEHWKIIIDTWSKSEHNSQIQNREKWIDILTMREPINFFKKNLNENIKIYRAGSQDGFSWTLKKETALEFQQRYSAIDNVLNERLRVRQKTVEATNKNCKVSRVNHRPRLEVTYRTRRQYDLP